MITALLLAVAVAVAGQINDEPVATKASPGESLAAKARHKVEVQAKVKAQAKALAASKAGGQAQDVVNARKARRAKYNKREAIMAAQEQADYRLQIIAQEKAIKEYQEYVVKMGPIWAAEHANQIQQQRNALIAQQTKNQEYLIWQLRTSK